MSGTKPSVSPALDREHLRTMCGDDPSFEQEIVLEFLELAARLVAEITAAAQSGNAKNLFESAHSLKGSSRSLGAGPLGDVCQEFESAGRDGKPPAADLLERIRTEYSRLEVELRAIGGSS